MKLKIPSMLILVFVGISQLGFTQTQNPLSEDSNPKSENTPLKNSVSSGQSAVQEQVPPAIINLINSKDMELVQFDPKMRQDQEDPYPLSSYQGAFFPEDIGAIRKEFVVSNITKVKATLERWYQKGDNTFPIEGYFMLGAIYDQLQCYPQALSILKDGRSKSHDPALMMNFLLAQSGVLRHSGKDQEAIDLLEEVSPKERILYPEIFFDQGLSFLYLKQYGQAVVRLRQYLTLVPDGVQSTNIRRAIAWLLLNKNGQIKPQESGDIGGASRKREQELAGMVQLLVQKQVQTDLGDLNRSATPNIQDKALNLAQKDLEDLEQYSNIAE